MSDPVKDYLADIGRRGGQSKSKKKVKASRTNAIKYRTEEERKEAHRKQAREWKQRNKKKKSPP